MTIQISKNLLFSTFGVDDFTALESTVNHMAPSLVEYHLNNFKDDTEDYYLNKKDVEKTLIFGSYSLYLDYDENIFLEIDSDLDEQTQSLW